MPSPQQLAERQAELVAAAGRKILTVSWRVLRRMSPADWWDDGTTSPLSGFVADNVTAGLKSVYNLGDAYARHTLGNPRTVKHAAPIYPRANVTPWQVYQRPVEQYRWKFAHTSNIDEALDAAQTRLEQEIEADVQRASSEAQRTVLASVATVTGYRRVIHPEMSKGGTCGLCIAAATRLYSVKELLPIHDRCHCTIMPVTEDTDPGLKLNDDDLKKLYAAVGTTNAADLKRVRVAEVTHGELGPLVVRAGQSYRSHSKAGAKAFTPPTVAEEVHKWETTLAVAEEHQALAERMIREGKTGEVEFHGEPFRINHPDKALDYYKTLIAKTKAKLQEARSRL